VSVTTPSQIQSETLQFDLEAHTPHGGWVRGQAEIIFNWESFQTRFSEWLNATPKPAATNPVKVPLLLDTDNAATDWKFQVRRNRVGNSTGSGGQLENATEDLSNVSVVYSTSRAFAALRFDGRVVVWGDPASGEDLTSGGSALQSSLAANSNNPVVHISSTESAFAALKKDGTVICWGNSAAGGALPTSVKTVLATKSVRRIYATKRAFAALSTDGSVVSWGSKDHGGNSSEVATDLASGVTKIFATDSAFSALKNDGSVVSWGHPLYGGFQPTNVAIKLNGDVVLVKANSRAFAALKKDATSADLSVVTWGFAKYGGNLKESYNSVYPSASPEEWETLETQLQSGVRRLYSTREAFAVMKSDRSIVAWGNPANGGNFGLQAPKQEAIFTIGGEEEISTFERVYSSAFAFAAVQVVPLTVKIDGIEADEAVPGGSSRALILTTSEKTSNFDLSNDLNIDPPDCGSVSKGATEGETIYNASFRPSSAKSQKCTITVAQDSFSAFEDLKNEESKLVFYVDAVPGKPTVTIDGIEEGGIVSTEVEVTFRLSEASSESIQPENAFTAADIIVQPTATTIPCGSIKEFAHSSGGKTLKYTFRIHSELPPNLLRMSSKFNII